jgi:hypothetical protein
LVDSRIIRASGFTKVLDRVQLLAAPIFALAVCLLAVSGPASAGVVSPECEDCVEQVVASLRDPKNNISCAKGSIRGGARAVFCDSALRIPNPFAIASLPEQNIEPGCRAYLLALSNLQAAGWIEEKGASASRSELDEVRLGSTIVASYGNRCLLDSFGSLAPLMADVIDIKSTGNRGERYCSALRPAEVPRPAVPAVAFEAFSLVPDAAGSPKGSCYGALTCDDKIAYSSIMAQVPPGLNPEQQTAFILEATKSVPGNSGVRIRRAALAESFRQAAKASRGQIEKAAARDPELELYLKFFKEDVDEYIRQLEKIQQQGFMDTLSMSILVAGGYRQPFEIAAQSYTESAKRLSNHVIANYQSRSGTQDLAEEVLRQIKATSTHLSQATRETGAQAVGTLNEGRLAAKAALGVALTVSTAGAAGVLPFLMNGAGWAALASAGSEVARAATSGDGDFWCGIADAEAKDPNAMGFASEVGLGAGLSAAAGAAGAAVAARSARGAVALGVTAGAAGAGSMAYGAYGDIKVWDEAIAKTSDPEAISCMQAAKRQVLAGAAVDAGCLLAGLANIGQANWASSKSVASRASDIDISSKGKSGSAGTSGGAKIDADAPPRIEMPDPPRIETSVGGGEVQPGGTMHPDGLVPVDYPVARKAVETDSRVESPAGRGPTAAAADAKPRAADSGVAKPAEPARLDSGSVRVAGADSDSAVALLRQKGLKPKHGYQLSDGSRMTLSEPFDLGEGRVGFTAIVEAADGTKSLRVFYKANSHIEFKVLPAINQNAYKVVGDDVFKLPSYDKGIGQHAIALPQETQQLLASLVKGQKKLPTLSHEELGTLVRKNTGVSGYAEWENAPDTFGNQVKSRSIEETASKPVLKASDSRQGALRDPSDIRIAVPGKAPDFGGTPVRTYSTSCSLIDGPVTVEVFPSKDGTLNYSVYRDPSGRVWFGSIEDVYAPISSYGVRTQAVEAGDLMSPLWDYRQAIAQGMAGQTNSKLSDYADNWDYVRQIPEVQRYFQERGITMPAAAESGGARSARSNGVMRDLPLNP